ncbi:MAG: glutathione peroxidase [Chitinophagales bacterium]
MEKTIYDFELDAIDGGKIDLNQYRGKKMLLVNTASECGYTYQYAALQELSTSFSQHLIVIGLPSNDFGAQEPGSEKEIHDFCQKRYGVAFPLSAKLQITHNPHPLIQWMQKQHSAICPATVIEWNFYKFLFDEKGDFIAAFNSATEPFSDTILQWINA